MKYRNIKLRISRSCENVLFRGDSIEVVVDVDGTELKARRGLDEQAIEVGEEVDVFFTEYLLR